MRISIMIAVSLACWGTVSSCQQSGVTGPPNAQKAEFERRGLKWPLAVDSGNLGCQGGAVWFATPDGTTYAVNGTAHGKYKPIEPIWLVDKKMMSELEAAGISDGPTLRVNIGDLIQEGLKSCS